MEEPGRLQSMGSLRVGHDWATSLSLFTFTQWRRQWQTLQCSCLENPRDGRAWWAAVYGVAQSRTRLKRLSSSSSSSSIVCTVTSKGRTSLVNEAASGLLELKTEQRVPLRGIWNGRSEPYCLRLCSPGSNISVKIQCAEMFINKCLWIHTRGREI